MAGGAVDKEIDTVSNSHPENEACFSRARRRVLLGLDRVVRRHSHGQTPNA